MRAPRKEAEMLGARTRAMEVGIGLGSLDAALCLTGRLRFKRSIITLRARVGIRIVHVRHSTLTFST